MDLADLNLGQLLEFGDDADTLMMLIWIIPILVFVFYGQRIQLHITSGEIKKGIKKLDLYRTESRRDLISYIKKTSRPRGDIDRQVDSILDYFTIMPVDLDPSGVVTKIKHTVRSREDRTREHVRSLLPDADELILTRIQTMLEIATTLRMFHKMINHMFLTAKKQNNYPLILPLQMMMPFVMEEAEAMRLAIPAFDLGQPIGDGIGPMVVGQMMLETEKEEISFQTVLGTGELEGRKLLLLKAKGPGSTVGRPGDALEQILARDRLDVIIMVDAALKLEGEESATIAQGFGAAIGGIGTERYQIEEIATINSIPVFSIIVKQSVKEALTLMTGEIASRADEVRDQVRQMVLANARPGQSVLVIGVGNTAGVPQ